MRGLARHGVCAVLLLVLTAATVSAECAWMLWREDYERIGGPLKKNWTTPLAYESRADCAAAIATRVQAWKGGVTFTAIAIHNSVGPSIWSFVADGPRSRPSA